MSNYVQLDNKQHKTLKLRDDLTLGSAEKIRNTHVVVQELQRLAADFPVFFTKNPETGQFSLVCVFGFDPGENLYCGEAGWEADYVPLNLQREPLALGSQKGAGGELETVALIDVEDPRLDTSEGDTLFDEGGSPTPLLQRKVSILKTLQEGQHPTRAFIDRMLALDLIVPATFKIEFKSGEKRQIDGLYTINQEAAKGLNPDAVLELYQHNEFEYIYMMIASIANFQTLIDRKNQSL